LFVNLLITVKDVKFVLINFHSLKHYHDCVTVDETISHYLVITSCLDSCLIMQILVLVISVK